MPQGSLATWLPSGGGKIRRLAGFCSNTAHDTISLDAASEQGPWFLAIDHTGVAAVLDITATDLSGPGVVRCTPSEPRGALRRHPQGLSTGSQPPIRRHHRPQALPSFPLHPVDRVLWRRSAARNALD